MRAPGAVPGSSRPAARATVNTLFTETVQPSGGLAATACARLLGDMEIMPMYRFERLVAEAIDDLPDELQPVLDNVVVKIEDRNPDEPDLLGLYDGVPHTERSGMEGPDIITIYRHALCEMCEDEDDLAEEIYVTVIHEIAHAAGIDDDRLHDLGWA